MQGPKDKDVDQLVDEDMSEFHYDDSSKESCSFLDSKDDVPNNNNSSRKRISQRLPWFQYRDFLPMYHTFLKDLDMNLPFMDFQLKVLNFYQSFPSQLHPNGWALDLAFEKLCSLVNMSPSISLFSHIFIPY